MSASAPAPKTVTQTQGYDSSRAGMFKGTIAVSVLYAALALGLIVGALVSESFRAALGDYQVFLATFVVGALVVMAVMVWNLLTYKIQVKKRVESQLLCPDYWDLTPTDATALAATAPVLKPFAKYKCVPRDSVFNSTSWGLPQGGWTGTLGTVHADMTAGLGGLKCNEVYPEIMAIKDVDASKQPTNALRCQYVSSCGNKFSWSGVCPAPAAAT